MTPQFWHGRRVFVTGHTGFKGAWLTLWLRRLGAEVCGYALLPPTEPSLHALACAAEGALSIEGDVRDLGSLQRALEHFQPDVVLHLAAQSVVLQAYRDPLETFSTNVMGTANVLEALRRHGRPLAVVNVTTDKVYRNDGRRLAYHEGDVLGGRDPYAASKACAELVAACWAPAFLDAAGIALGNARAGNVVGGGDWTPHQLVPAVVAAAHAGQAVELRHPQAVRPWQHVLDCLRGYLTLAQALVERPQAAAGDWNFGPAPETVRTVAQVAERLAGHWGVRPAWRSVPQAGPHEEQLLSIDSSKAATHLGWSCLLSPDESFDWVARWHHAHAQGTPARAICEAQIDAFMARLPVEAA